MAGNSQRRGAVRKGGRSRAVGSGGQGRQALEGRGPTPKAVDRVGHPASKPSKHSKHSKPSKPSRHGAGQRTRSNSSGSRGTSGSATRSTSGRGRRAAKSASSSEIVTGRNAVVEALQADLPVSTMYLAARIDTDDRVKLALAQAAARGIPVLECPRTELDRITDGAVHQGLALRVPPYEYANLAELLAHSASARVTESVRATENHPSHPEWPPLIVALDGITDPRNLGAVVRSVGAFGGSGVVVPQRRSVGMTASAWKTSAGAAARVPVALAGNLTRALLGYQKAGCFVVGLDADGDQPLPELDLADQPLVLVVGSEGKGLSRLVRETCDRVVSIPMAGPVESLNAAVAASVALYEVARSRG